MSILSVVTDYIKDKFRGGSNTIAINVSKSGVKDQTSMACFGPGIEINPANGENLVLTRIGNSNSFVVSVGGVNQNIEPDTERGERKIYSVSEDGTEIKASIKLKNDGGLEIISTGSDVSITNENGSISLEEDGSITLTNSSGTYKLTNGGVHNFNNALESAVKFLALSTALISQDTSINGELTKLSATITAMVVAFAALGVTIPPYVQGTVTTDISSAEVTDVKLG